MNKFGIILGHTYMSRLKSKAFIITTVITVAFLFAFANIENIINFFMSDETEEVAVIDESNALFMPLSSSLEEVLDDVELKAFTEDVEAGKAAVEDEEYIGLLVLNVDEAGLPVATYYANDAVESSTELMINQQLQQMKTVIASEQAGIDPSLLETINEPIVFEKVSLDEAAKTEEEIFQAQGIVYIMLFALYMTVIIYGQMIATDVATEKSSRVMEILVSSAKPVTHMYAKIAGIALLGLTQIAIIGTAGYLMISSKIKDNAGEFFEIVGLADTSISIYLYAILFFILGYLLYATIAAMLGSLVSRVEDVQQLLLPMMLLIIAAFMIAMAGLNVPEAKFITVTSFIPFFTPMIMFLRVGMLDIPLWEVGAGVGVLVVAILFFAWLGARIYRGGVLMYGPSRSLKDFKKAFQATKKEK